MNIGSKVEQKEISAKDGKKISEADVFCNNNFTLLTFIL
jgi:ABC-type Zn uptake system ZnuABC Zn-binding protein ZnuA